MKPRRTRKVHAPPPGPEAPRPAIVGDKAWYKNGIAVLALLAAFAGLTATLTAILDRFTSPQPQQLNIQLLVDASTSASIQPGSQIGDFIRNQAFRRALSTVPQGANVSARVFGGECQDYARSSTLVARFKVGQRDDLPSKILGYRNLGKRTLGQGLIDAAGDFSESKLFEGKVKRLIVVTSGDDECIGDFGSRETLLAIIRQRLIDSGVKPEVHILGLNVPEQTRSFLEAMAKSVDGSVRYATSAEDVATLIAAAAAGESVRDSRIAGIQMRPTTPSAASVPLGQSERPSSSVAVSSEAFAQESLPSRDLGYGLNSTSQWPLRPESLPSSDRAESKLRLTEAKLQLAPFGPSLYVSGSGAQSGDSIEIWTFDRWWIRHEGETKVYADGTWIFSGRTSYGPSTPLINVISRDRSSRIRATYNESTTIN